jgi:hypothetical protein
MQSLGKDDIDRRWMRCMTHHMNSALRLMATRSESELPAGRCYPIPCSIAARRSRLSSGSCWGCRACCPAA